MYSPSFLFKKRITPEQDTSDTDINSSPAQLIRTLPPSIKKIEINTAHENVPVLPSQHRKSLVRTHDIQGCLRAGIDLLKNTSEELAREDKDALLHELLQEALELCTNKTQNLLLESISTSHKKPLTKKQIAALQNIKNSNDVCGIILLAEDSLSNLKIVLNKLKAEIKSFESQQGNVNIITTNCMHGMDPDEWEHHRLAIEHVGPWAIVCASNGETAFEVTRICSVLGMITDHEMPGMLGSDLIQAIRTVESNKGNISMKIVLNTALTKGMMTERGINIDDLDVVHLCKGLTSTEVFKNFWNSVIDLWKNQSGIKMSSTDLTGVTMTIN